MPRSGFTLPVNDISPSALIRPHSPHGRHTHSSISCLNSIAKKSMLFVALLPCNDIVYYRKTGVTDGFLIMFEMTAYRLCLN